MEENCRGRQKCLAKLLFATIARYLFSPVLEQAIETESSHFRCENDDIIHVLFFLTLSPDSAPPPPKHRIRVFCLPRDVHLRSPDPHSLVVPSRSNLTEQNLSAVLVAALSSTPNSRRPDLPTQPVQLPQCAHSKRQVDHPPTPCPKSKPYPSNCRSGETDHKDSSPIERRMTCTQTRPL
jgi:hypothetical protein